MMKPACKVVASEPLGSIKMQSEVSCRLNSGLSPLQCKKLHLPTYVRRLLLLIPAMVMMLVGCRKESSQMKSSSAAAETSYAYIQCMFDTLGIRYAEIDTVQKSFQMPDGVQKSAHKIQQSGHGLPVYSARPGRSLRWSLAPNATFKMQTWSTDSSGNFCFNQLVEYTSLKGIFERGQKSRFNQVPFQIIHKDTVISFIGEEYVP